MDVNLKETGTKKLIMMISEKTEELSSMLQDYSELAKSRDPDLIKSKESAIKSVMDDIDLIISEANDNKRRMDLMVLEKINRITVMDIITEARNTQSVTESGIEIVHDFILNDGGEEG